MAKALVLAAVALFTVATARYADYQDQDSNVAQRQAYGDYGGYGYQPNQQGYGGFNQGMTSGYGNQGMSQQAFGGMSQQGCGGSDQGMGGFPGGQGGQGFPGGQGGQGFPGGQGGQGCPGGQGGFPGGQGFPGPGGHGHIPPFLRNVSREALEELDKIIRNENLTKADLENQVTNWAKAQSDVIAKNMTDLINELKQQQEKTAQKMNEIIKNETTLVQQITSIENNMQITRRQEREQIMALFKQQSRSMHEVMQTLEDAARMETMPHPHGPEGPGGPEGPEGPGGPGGPEGPMGPWGPYGPPPMDGQPPMQQNGGFGGSQNM